MEKFCSICQFDFTSPKLVSSKHSWCPNCLSNTYMNSKKICQDFIDPLSPLEADVMAQLESLKLKSEAKFCDTCEIREVIYYCTECEHHFCELCKPHHDKVQLNKSHTIVGVHSPFYQHALKRFRHRICSKHNKIVDIHCNTCSEFMCYACFLANHKKHDFVDIKSKYEEEKENIESALVKLKSSLSNCRHQLDLVENVKIEGQMKTISDITSRCNELKAEIDKAAQCLINQSNKHYESYYSQRREFVDSAKREQITMQNNVQMLQLRLQNLNESTIVDMEPFQFSTPVWKPFAGVSRKIEFLPSKLGSLESLKQHLGQVVCRMDPSDTLFDRVFAFGNRHAKMNN